MKNNCFNILTLILLVNWLKAEKIGNLDLVDSETLSDKKFLAGKFVILLVCMFFK